MGRPRLCRAAALTVLSLAAMHAAEGAELMSVSIEKTGERYLMQSRTLFDASPEDVYRVLADYDRFERISSIFEDVHFIEPDTDGTPRAFTLVKGCVFLFCKTIRRIERLEFKPHTDIVAVVEPEHSDFRYGRTEWRFIPAGKGTEVVYRMEMEPGFWVPPIIGPYMMKRSFRKDAVEALDRIEALARGEEPAS